MKPDLLTIPATGFTRMSKLLEFVPYKRSTIYQKIKEGLFPAPSRFGDRVSAFRNEDLHAWFAAHAGKGSADHE